LKNHRFNPTVIRFKRRGAQPRRDCAEQGLPLIDAILGNGDLADYHLAHAARADLCRRLGRTADARAAYERALALTRQEPERRFLQRRLGGVGVKWHAVGDLAVFGRWKDFCNDASAPNGLAGERQEIGN